MLRTPHCLDNRLTDGDKVFSPTHRPHFTPQKHYYFYVSDTHFCWRLGKSEGLVRPEGLGKLKKFIHHIGSRTRDLSGYQKYVQYYSEDVVTVAICNL
jgi:hypothetical protein